MSNKSGSLRYVGDGAFIIGVPARDLTAAETRKYRPLIGDSPLYEPAEEATEDAAGDAPTASAPVDDAKAGKTGKEGA
jgi:hypothetical protein